MRSITITAAVLLLATPALAQNETYTEADAELLQACMDSAGGSPEEPAGSFADCIGAASTPCMEEPGGSSTLGMVTCMRREESWWRERMDAEIENWRGTASEESLALLDAAQEAWTTYLPSQCEFLYSAGEGTIQQLVYASCMLDGTARRAIELIPSY